MFPHNSSSHEIFTETNAFVQNSKGDVVVLEGCSLSGVGEGKGPEHARYCDIEFINSSMMAAAPTIHPEATAANDFLTVLLHHSGELGSAGVCEAHKSVAPAIINNTTNHLLTYDNNDKLKSNYNNAEHNHHKSSKQKGNATAKTRGMKTSGPMESVESKTTRATPGSLGQLGSSADNSKSISKPLSDNKYSFSDINIRVLKISLYLKEDEEDVTRGNARGAAGVPSLVRISKSEWPRRLAHFATSVYNYSLLGSRLGQGDNNNLKANLSWISNNNSKSVILLSSSSYGDYYQMIITNNNDGGSNGSNRTKRRNSNNDDDKDAETMTTTINDREQRERRNLIISDNEDVCFEMELYTIDSAGATERVIIAASYPVGSSSTTLIVSKNESTHDDDFLTRARLASLLFGPVTVGAYVTLIELVQRICVPLSLGCKEPPARPHNTSCITTTNVSTLGSQKDGISCTEATICTVGALSFQDNNKFNSPLNHSLSVSKSSVNNTIKKEKIEEPAASRRPTAAYIPTPTTCEPTMTLTRPSATTVTSQTNAPVPADLALEQTHNQVRAIRVLVDAYRALRATKSNCERQRQRLIGALKLFNARPRAAAGYAVASCRPAAYDPVLDYKRRWGIPTGLALVGGGESSLNNTGTANWGATQATTPNNNNAAAQAAQAAAAAAAAAAASGWGPAPTNPTANAGPPNNWAQNNVNRSVAGNPNQNQNQGPPGGQNNPGNVNKVTNPNQPPNAQSGPPTSQSSNTAQANQANAGQWSQTKSNNPGPNPASAANNNNNNVPPQQPTGANPNNNQMPNPTPGNVGSNNTPASNNASTKQQLEQLNTMREALFSQDGWGCVNQDTNWDVPSSPEPSMSKDGVPMWKPPVNNGTDLWEANLRNGGQPPPQQQAKTPWGPHTPSTNIGGTWGEDDEAADSSNMWTGAPAPNQPNTAQWPGAATANQNAAAWGDPRNDPRDPRDIRSVDPREMRDPRDHRMSLDPREHMRVMDPMARDPRMADMRGDPRGISGRLNGASADAMLWAQQSGPPHHQMSHQQHPTGPPTKMINPSGMNQWAAAPPPKDMIPPKPSGWEEPSPPPVRRNVPNYDDGTSLWGNPGSNQRAIPASKVSHWKDIPAPNIARTAMQCPPGMPQNRMPGQPSMKSEVTGPMWAHPSGGPNARNGSWGDAGPHESSGWDEPKTPTTWNEQQLAPATWGPSSHKPKPMGPTGNWTESEMEAGPSWAHPTKPALTKEVIWNSREFRYLCDLGYKKEDVETALRTREMNREEALELLSQMRPVDQWRRPETHSSYDPSNQSSSSQGYPRFNHVAQQMSFPPNFRPLATSSVSGSVANASLLKLQQQQQQQADVQLQQQQPNANTPKPPFNQATRTPQNPPSTQQLRMLVQQIQLAVQEGYLNHQILNQPLAPQTLILLNQLLQQIKVLHTQLNVQSTLKGNGQNVLQISVEITKTKQQITNLQNQIAVQQATYMKQQQQQQQQQHPMLSENEMAEYWKKMDNLKQTDMQNIVITAIQKTLNWSISKEPQSQQQSRLNQWKLPSLDKDGDATSNEFSRAPGTTSKAPATPGSLTQSHSSPNINPLLGQGDGTWSSRLGDSGWPDAANNDSTDGKDWQPGGAAFTDLVPEFEPGKPWKMKSIEDDPSITPGSVVRSPLSLAAIKDSDTIFSSSTKTSPPPQPINTDTSIPSLSNSTWSFNPPASTPSTFTSSKNTWGESAAPPPTAVTSELWGAPINKARGGPPPGLGNKSGIPNASNGWGLGAVSRTSSSWALQSAAAGGGSSSGWVSTWLLLKNLTPQIDGSTLKTLCMQHGPVQDFRLYLNHGIALTKYSSRDEAIKAQGALNNCVLGNTTIFAESPADGEVHSMLQQLSHGSSGGQQQANASGGTTWGMRPTNKSGPPPDTWSGSSNQLWGAPPSNPNPTSLWSNSGIDSSDQQRATPSSLNSYLPGDLLGVVSP